MVAALLGAAMAMVFVLDWRASRATGRGLRASVPLVPSEAQRLYMDVRRSRPVEATKSATKSSLEKVTAAL
jgi:hypothetical protein